MSRQKLNMNSALCNKYLVSVVRVSISTNLGFSPVFSMTLPLSLKFSSKVNPILYIHNMPY